MPFDVHHSFWTWSPQDPLPCPLLRGYTAAKAYLVPFKIRVSLGRGPRGHSTTGGEYRAGKQEQLGHSRERECKILLGPVSGYPAGPCHLDLMANTEVLQSFLDAFLPLLSVLCSLVLFVLCVTHLLPSSPLFTHLIQQTLFKVCNGTVLGHAMVTSTKGCRYFHERSAQTSSLNKKGNKNESNLKILFICILCLRPIGVNGFGSS